MKILDIFRNRIVIFGIQFLILSLFIFIQSYTINLEFDAGIIKERELIIQFLANYVFFDKVSGLLFVYIIWFTVSLIPIFVYVDFKKAYSLNLLAFFFFNFFLYVFLSRYSGEYFNSNFRFHFINTILLGIFIVGISITLSIILKKIIKSIKKPQIANLEAIARSISTKCPKCGTEFNSRPKICYNCNRDLTIKKES